MLPGVLGRNVLAAVQNEKRQFGLVVYADIFEAITVNEGGYNDRLLRTDQRVRGLGEENRLLGNFRSETLNFDRFAFGDVISLIQAEGDFLARCICILLAAIGS